MARRGTDSHHSTREALRLPRWWGRTSWRVGYSCAHLTITNSNFQIVETGYYGGGVAATTRAETLSYDDRNGAEVRHQLRIVDSNLIKCNREGAKSATRDAKEFNSALSSRLPLRPSRL